MLSTSVISRVPVRLTCSGLSIGFSIRRRSIWKLYGKKAVRKRLRSTLSGGSNKRTGTHLLARLLYVSDLNPAETLRWRGELVEARKLQEAALSINRRTLGDEHPSTLTI